MIKGILTAVLAFVFISYGVSAPCSLPVVGAVTGLTSTCTNATITLADITLGGTWSSSNTGIATVDSLGVVTGLTAGYDTIIYSATNTCGTSTALYPITVLTSPTATITPNGVLTFCAGDSVQLVARGTGGEGSPALDQSQLIYNGGMSARNLPGYNEWQSFTAGITGTLTQIDIGFFNAINGSGTLNIFSGSGTTGTLLQTQTVTVICSSGNCMLPFAVSAPVTAGQVYTFQFIPGTGIPDPYGVQVEDPGTYTGGQMDLVDPSGTYPTGFDMVFETFVAGPGGLHYQWSTSATDTAIEVYTMGNYAVTVSDSSGCATSDTIHVTVNQAAASQFSDTICSGSSYSFNNQTLIQNGFYKDTLQTIHGCDSIVTLNLTVNSVLQTALSDSICNGSSVMLNGHSYAQAGTYYDTLQSVSGCDSIVTLNLSIKSTSGDTVRATAAPAAFCSGDSTQVCATQGFTSYYWSNHDTGACFYTLNAGSYSVTVTDLNGCTVVSDTISIITYTPMAVTISASGDTLTSFGAGGYQWYFNNQLIPGDTGSVIIAQHSGAYTVETTDSNGCHYISSVTQVNTGIGNVNEACTVKLYPNPGTGNFTLQFTDDVAREVEITDAVGRTVMGATKVTMQKNFNLEELAAGVYFLRITENNEVKSLKFNVVR